MVDQLLAYQEVDKKLKDIELELGRSDERRKTHSAQAFLKGANDQIAALDGRAEELANRFAALTATCSRLFEEIKEYDGLDVGEDLEQVAYIKKKAQALAGEIETLSDSLDGVTKEIGAVLKEFAKLKKEINAAQEQYKEYAPKYNALKDAKKDEIEAVRKELAKLEKEVPPDIMEKYKQRRKEKIFPVLNKANELGKSGAFCACGKALPDFQYKTLSGGGIVECESCHRLLYLDK